MGTEYEEQDDEWYSDAAEKILHVRPVNFSKMTLNEKGQIRNRVFRQSERFASEGVPARRGTQPT